jgi:hypothetical protein
MDDNLCPSNDLFPLTLALSLRERVGVRGNDL